MHRTISLLCMFIGVAALLLGCAAPEAPEAPVNLAAGTGSAPETEGTGEDPADLILNGRMPFEGILTGGQPSPEEYKAIADLGYKTVVNLRTSGAGGGQDVEALGMTYVSIPVNGAEGLTMENARALDDVLKEVEYPVLVHCASGNRVGALFALRAFQIEGKSPEEALEIGRSAGLNRLEPAVRKILGLDQAM